jgi:AraC-like DNA-binding protein
MRNRFFSERALGVALEPSRWRLVSSQCPPDIRPIADRVHSAWTRRNPHAHAHREIVVALEGTVPYGLRGEVYPCRPGTVILFEPMESHDFDYPEEHFSAGLIGRRHGVRKGLMRRVFPQTQALPLLDQCWSDLRELAAHSPRLARLRVFSVLSAMMARVVEAGYERAPVPDRYAFQEQVVSAIRRHIAKTAGRGVSLDHLARLAGYSKYHFHRLFKRIAGLSLKRYVDVCRMDKVREMTEEGRSQTQISDALGFSCLAAFSRWHKHQRSARRAQ